MKKEKTKMVYVTLKRIVYYETTKEMTKKEYQNFKENYEGFDISGADCLNELGRDASEEPDRWEDEMDDLQSDWDEEEENENKKHSNTLSAESVSGKNGK